MSGDGARGKDWLRARGHHLRRVRSSGLAYLSVETFSPTSDSNRAAVGGWQKDEHLVLVNGLEAYPGAV